jgi:hypothetical protein
MRVVIRMPQQLRQTPGEPVRNGVLQPLCLIVYLLPIVTGETESRVATLLVEAAPSASAANSQTAFR